LKSWRSELNIAIIGNGNVGAALGQALGRCGHQIIFGVRSPAPGASNESTIPEAIRESHATILAVPFTAVTDVIKSAGDLSGKVLIDATNPLGMIDGGLGLTMGYSTSGAEQIAALAPGARVFKAFNQTGFENMADALPYAAQPVMFVAGDDPNGKQAVISLVSDAGFDAVDLGGLRQARLLEPLAMLWIELARKRGRGPDFTFSLQQKGSTL
jgi:predicted dinucleotide-binding enzyme